MLCLGHLHLKQLLLSWRESLVNFLRDPLGPLNTSFDELVRLERAIFRTPSVHTVVITTSAGRDELTRRGAATLGSVEIHALNSSSGRIAPLAILQLLHSQFGIQTVLHEGGPTLLGQFLAAEAVDELFLTLSPQIAGRNVDLIRPALVQGVAFVPDSAPWFQLLSVKQKAEHLYLRYRRIGVPLDVVNQNF